MTRYKWRPRWIKIHTDTFKVAGKRCVVYRRPWLGTQWTAHVEPDWHTPKTFPRRCQAKRWVEWMISLEAAK